MDDLFLLFGRDTYAFLFDIILQLYPKFALVNSRLRFADMPHGIAAISKVPLDAWLISSWWQSFGQRQWTFQSFHVSTRVPVASILLLRNFEANLLNLSVYNRIALNALIA